jgi:hypothetical protein
VRSLLIILLLAVACSTKTSTSDAQGQDAGADTTADTTADTASEEPGFGGFPKCTFTATTSSTACNLAACMYRDAGSEPADADSFGCWPCPDDYACAILCPSPNGGCGPPAICCPVTP